MNRLWFRQDAWLGQPQLSPTSVLANSGVQLISASIAASVATAHRPDVFPVATDSSRSRAGADPLAERLFAESMDVLVCTPHETDPVHRWR